MDGVAVSLITFTLSVVLNFFVNLIAWQVTGIAALRFWAISNLLTFAGLGFLFFYKFLPWKGLLVLQNLGYFASIILVPAGLFSYRGLHFPWVRHSIILAAGLAVMAWATLVHDSFSTRVVISSVYIGAYAFYVSYLILRHTRGKGPLMGFAVGAWGLYGIINFARLAMAATGFGVSDGQPFQGLAYMLIFVFAPVCTTGGYFGLILLIVQRLVDEKQSSLAATERMAQQYRELSDHDPLTNALNSRSFMAELQQVMEKCRKSNVAVCVMMADLDHFKRINDTYGHAAGDKTLKKAVQVWQSSLRHPDRLGRVGGEEFAIVLPNTDMHEAVHIAERLRKGIAAAQIQEPEIITASFGIAQMAAGETAEDLLHRADNAMYEAKKQGRNRVMTDRKQVPNLPRTTSGAN